MSFPTDNGNFVNAMDLFDFSQGSPGALYRLYRAYALPEIRNYLEKTALPQLTDPNRFLMRSAYLQPLAMYAENPDRAAECAPRVAELCGPSLRRDWPGICAPFHFGVALWRKYAAPAFSICEEVDLTGAVYDPAAKRLELELSAGPSSRLVVEGATPKRIFRNGEPVSAKAVEAGFRLPLLSGKNEFVIEY